MSNKNWMHVYLGAMRDGCTDEEARLRAGITYETLKKAEAENAGFRATLFMITQGVRSGFLSPQELQKVLEAQNTDELAAAYFSMDVPTFLAEIEKSEALKRVYNTARQSGRAKMHIAQWDTALEGSETMQKHIGKHHLGQSDEQKISVEVKHEQLDFPEMVRRLMIIEQEQKRIGNTIDADFEDITTSEKQLVSVEVKTDNEQSEGDI